MAAATFDEEQMRDLLKSALVEALEEHRDLVKDIVERESLYERQHIKRGPPEPLPKQGGVFVCLGKFDTSPYKEFVCQLCANTSEQTMTKRYGS